MKKPHALKTPDGDVWILVPSDSKSVGNDGSSLTKETSGASENATAAKLPIWKKSKGTSCEKDVFSLNPSADWALARGTLPAEFKCEQVQYIRMAISRIGKRRSGASFGNARAVQAYYEDVRSRQAARISAEQEGGGRPDLMLLTKEDLLGPQVTSESIRRGPAYSKLQALECLAPVKKAVDSLIELVSVNAQREETGKPVLEVVLNRVLLGNPGTGKTIVARIYGQLLSEMGLLSKGDVVLKTASDFISDALGSSEVKTRDILRAPEGCVLVIDEAYGLYSGDIDADNPYGSAVINTIVEQVQAEAGEDRAVLLLGYRTEMERMLKKSNPGLARRFQLQNAFDFPYYSDDELLRILLAKAHSCELTIDMSVAKRAVGLLAKARAKPNFGNAGSVEILLSEAKTRLLVGESVLTLQAFGIPEDDSMERVLDNLLDDMVNCSSAKQYLQELQNVVTFAHNRGDDPREQINYNILFLGNPGTGKTTIARRIGTMFHALGLLPEDRVTEVSASELVTGFAGQAGKNTRNILESCRGGVLLIDEAYQLDPKRGGSYMTEVVDELVRCTTLVGLQKNLVIILAGYTEQMMEMLKINKGLASRFSEALRFENMDVESVTKLLMMKLREKQLEIEEGIENDLQQLATQMILRPNFANGRDVISWSNAIYKEFSKTQATSRQHRNTVRTQEHTTCKINLHVIQTAFLRMTDGENKCFDLRCQSVSNKVSSSSKLNSSGPHEMAQEVDFQASTMTQHSRVFNLNIELKKQKADAESQLTDMEENNLSESPEETGFQLDNEVLKTLQNLLDEMGLNSENGFNSILDNDKNEKILENLLLGLEKGGLSKENAKLAIENWMKGLNKVQMKLKEVERFKRAGKRPIWRCAVCGQADKPWIACWVAPYIVRYESI